MITSEKYHQYNIQCTCNIKLVSRYTRGLCGPDCMVVLFTHINANRAIKT